MRSEPQPIMPNEGLFLASTKPPDAQHGMQHAQQAQHEQHEQQSEQQEEQQSDEQQEEQSDAQQSTGLQQASRYLPLAPLCQPLRAASISA